MCLRGQGEFLWSSRRGHPHGGTPGEPINYRRSDTGTAGPVIDASCAAGELVSHAGRGVKDLPLRKRGGDERRGGRGEGERGELKRGERSLGEERVLLCAQEEFATSHEA